MDIEEIEKIISKDRIYIDEPMNKYTSFKMLAKAVLTLTCF